MSEKKLSAAVTLCALLAKVFGGLLIGGPALSNMDGPPPEPKRAGSRLALFSEADAPGEVVGG